jgi:hypothetical protein
MNGINMSEKGMSNSLSITTSPPQFFVTIYDWRTGVEVFDCKDRCWLKLLAQLMSVSIVTYNHPRPLCVDSGNVKHKGKPSCKNTKQIFSGQRL